MILAFAILVLSGTLVALELFDLRRLRREEQRYKEYRERLSGVAYIHEIARRNERAWIRKNLAAGAKRRKAKTR